MANDIESPEEDTTESPVDESAEQSGSVKVSEAFQKRATALVDGLNTIPELNFLSDLVMEQRKKIESSQKKSKLNTDSFSTDGMPT